MFVLLTDGFQGVYYTDRRLAMATCPNCNGSMTPSSDGVLGKCNNCGYLVELSTWGLATENRPNEIRHYPRSDTSTLLAKVKDLILQLGIPRQKPPIKYCLRFSYLKTGDVSYGAGAYLYDMAQAIRATMPPNSHCTIDIVPVSERIAQEEITDE
jgi:hypothetical protein